MQVTLEERGVLGAGQVKKGGLYRGTYLLLNIYVSTPPPPPPPPPPGVTEGKSINIRLFLVDQLMFLHHNLLVCMMCSTYKASAKEYIHNTAPVGCQNYEPQFLWQGSMDGPCISSISRKTHPFPAVLEIRVCFRQVPILNSDRLLFPVTGYFGRSLFSD